MTLRQKLVGAFTFLTLLAMLPLAVPLAINVAERARTDFALQLNATAERVAAVAAPSLAADDTDVDALVRRHDAIGRVILTDADAVLIADSRERFSPGRDYTYRPEIREALAGRPTRLVRNFAGQGHYVVAVPVIGDGSVVGAVRVSEPLTAIDAMVGRRLLLLAAVVLGVLLVGMAVWAAVARRLTTPLRRLAAVASDIGAGDLHRRAPETGQREVAEVAEALNNMCDRLQEAIDAQSDFVANASHQLRTPLTGLRLRLEALDAAGIDGAAEALAETDRLSGLIDQLLLLVRMDTAPEDVSSVDVLEAARQALDRWQVQAGETGHVLRLVGESAAVVGASATDVAIVLDNLIENALKYTPYGTTVTVALRVAGGGVDLSVSDDGPGMTPEDRRRAFERFYRGSTGKSVSGTGLGLAIVRAIAQRWGGMVALDADGQTRITVWLPLTGTSAGAAAGTEPIPTVR